MQDPHIRGSDSARLEDLQFLGEQAEYNFATSGIQSPPKTRQECGNGGV